MLVTSLRTADFFCSKTARKQKELHFPGDFLPWKFSIEQQRNRYPYTYVDRDGARSNR